MLRLSLLCCSWSRQHKMQHCRSRKAKSNSCEGSFRLQKPCIARLSIHSQGGLVFETPLCRVFPGPVSSFALRFCGGTEGNFLRETEIFVRSSGHTRALGLAFWEVLSQDFKRGQEQIPYLPTRTDEVGTVGVWDIHVNSSEKCLHETARKRS